MMTKKLTLTGIALRVFAEDSCRYSTASVAMPQLCADSAPESTGLRTPFPSHTITTVIGGDVMIVNHRTCRLQPGRAREMKHLGHLVGDSTKEVGNVNEIGHIWAYQDLADRAKCRAAMAVAPAR